MIHIVNATPTDAVAIQTLLKDTWKDTYGDYLSQATLDEVYENWISIEFLTNQIENSAIYFPLAKDRDEIVGISTTGMREDVIVMPRLYVSPQHQRKGIGELLLNSVIAHFQDAKKLQLNVQVMNVKGQSFYKKHGFVEIKRTEEKLVNEVIEVILMEKPL